MDNTWQTMSLDSDPRFIVGYRKNSGLIDCYNMELHQDLFADLRQIGRAALDYLGRSIERPYAPFGALEEDEYFLLGRSEIPRPVQTRKKQELAPDNARTGGETNPDQLHGVAEALRIIDETDRHPVLSPVDFHEGSRFNLYAISFQVGNDFVGFIRQANPRRSLKPGLRYFQYGDTLKRMEQPDVVIDEKVDIIVSPENIAIVSEKSVQVLFRDVDIVMQQVDVNVDEVSVALRLCLPVTAGGLDALRIVCSRGPRNAKRLHDLVHIRFPLVALNSSTFLTALRQRQLGHLVANDRLHLTENDVPDFLDFVEGRLFDDDHSPETRRADRFSPRN